MSEYVNNNVHGGVPYGWTADTQAGPYGGVQAWNWTDGDEIDERRCAEPGCKGYHTKKTVYCRGHEKAHGLVKVEVVDEQD